METNLLVMTIRKKRNMQHIVRQIIAGLWAIAQEVKSNIPFD